MENISEKFFIENFDDEMLFQFEENKGYRMIDYDYGSFKCLCV